MFLWEAFSALEVLRSSFVLKTLAEVEEVAGKPRGDRDLMKVSVHALQFQPQLRSMRQKNTTEGGALLNQQLNKQLRNVRASTSDSVLRLEGRLV